MSNIFLHVGLHKTGTSAIQRSLHENSQWLLEQGFFYPKPGSFDAHHSLVSLLKTDNNGELANRAGEDEFLRKIHEYIDQAAGKTIILSSEIFSEPARRTIVGKLRDLFDSVKVVLYLRRQDLLLESVHNQMLKQQGIRCDNIAQAWHYSYNFHSLLSKWDALAGNQNLIVRRYEKPLLFQGDVYLDFLRCIGVPVDSQTTCTSSPVNQSLSLLEYLVLDRLQLMNPPSWPNAVEVTKRVVADSFATHDQNMVGHYLNLDERNTILNGLADENRKVLERFFPEDARLFTPPDNRDGGRYSLELLRDVDLALQSVRLAL